MTNSEENIINTRDWTQRVFKQILGYSFSLSLILWNIYEICKHRKHKTQFRITYWSIEWHRNYVAGPKTSNPHSDGLAAMKFNSLCIKKSQSYSAVQRVNHQPQIHLMGRYLYRKEIQNIMSIGYQAINSFTHSIDEVNERNECSNKCGCAVCLVYQIYLTFWTEWVGW